MPQSIPARPTLYRGITFRSRLEARWAAFFDQCEWTWQYEPEIVIPGWLPDFSIAAHAGPILVEVKPIDRFDEALGKRLSDAVIHAGLEHHLLILGLGPWPLEASICVVSASGEPITGIGWYGSFEHWEAFDEFTEVRQHAWSSAFLTVEASAPGRFSFNSEHPLVLDPLALPDRIHGTPGVHLAMQDNADALWGQSYAATRYTP